jgi:hypothetical protein
MTRGIEVIYDRAIADEKLKDGTKYERLTAIVFKILQESACVVHDVRLRGDGKLTSHQIDVQIDVGPEGGRRRILIECKDHEPGTKAGLSELRDFNGALVALQPVRGVFVTTNGYTAPACSYAKDENITLVELRPFIEQDWEGLLREIRLRGVAFYRGTPTTDWTSTGRTAALASDTPNMSRGVWLDSTVYYDEAGVIRGTLASLLEGWQRDLLAAGVPSDGTSEISGTYTLPHPVWLPTDGVLAEFTGFSWKAPIERVASEIFIQSEQIADLILRSVQLSDGARLSDAIGAELAKKPKQIFFHNQIVSWTVGEDHVIQPVSRQV